MPNMNPKSLHHGGIIYVVTPWRNASELLDVRAKLFDEGSSIADRTRAVGLINAWGMRGKIPHAMQSTAMLMSAQLNHEASDSMAFCIQATYATAISRFISGYCDISMANQVRRSMHSEAERLGIPASWVDLRHDAIHSNKLPGVARLASVAKEALKWLWNDYWFDLGEQQLQGSALSPTDDSLFSLEEVRASLDTFKKERTVEHRIGVDPTLLGSASSNLVVSLMEQCGNQQTHLEDLISILLEPGMLIPRNVSEVETDDPLVGAHVLWDVVLKALSRHQSKFLSLLLRRMTADLAEDGHMNRDDTFMNAIQLWILHALSKFSENHVARAKLTNQVLSDCVSVPSKWCTKLAERVIESDPSLLEIWGPYLSVD